ncbi:hypothetical protein H0V99_02250 [Candidatus Saccharibacteria bacterium]|nr:hypothetical protein [Candidatus Saccharibacteria bacterium]
MGKVIKKIIVWVVILLGITQVVAGEPPVKAVGVVLILAMIFWDNAGRLKKKND